MAIYVLTSIYGFVYYVFFLEGGILEKIFKSRGLTFYPVVEALITLFLAASLISVLLAILIGVFYSFDVPGKSSIDNVFIEGFRRLFPFLLVFLFNIFIVILGLLFFIIPGIYLSIRYSQSLSVLVLENKRGFSALSKSKKLTEGCFWSLTFKYLILICLMAVFYYVIFSVSKLNTGFISLLVPLFGIPFSMVFPLAYQFNIYRQLSQKA